MSSSSCSLQSDPYDGCSETVTSKDCDCHTFRSISNNQSPTPVSVLTTGHHGWGVHSWVKLLFSTTRNLSHSMTARAGPHCSVSTLHVCSVFLWNWHGKRWAINQVPWCSLDLRLTEADNILEHQWFYECLSRPGWFPSRPLPPPAPRVEEKF